MGCREGERGEEEGGGGMGHASVRVIIEKQTIAYKGPTMATAKPVQFVPKLDRRTRCACIKIPRSGIT